MVDILIFILMITMSIFPLILYMFSTKRYMGMYIGWFLVGSSVILIIKIFYDLWTN